MVGLESRILRAALGERNDKRARDLTKMFVAVRRQRRKGMPMNLVLREGEREYSEGTAEYSRARMYQLLAENGGIEPKNRGKDPQYQGFPNAGEEYERMISKIIPPKGQRITFSHSMYRHGMAQCLILDRVRPGWKEEMREKGMTQFALLEKEFVLEEKMERKLLAKARERFDYDDLLSQQEKVVEEVLELVRGYINAPGRRYCIYHGEISGEFRWKPVVPVYDVPEWLEKELAEERKKKGSGKEKVLSGRMVWVGGIRRFEKEGVVFESGNTPIIFGREYIEWIDLDPAPDQSDMKIESESEHDGVHVGVTIKTDGFTLEAKRARIEWSTDVVRIHPIGESHLTELLQFGKRIGVVPDLLDAGTGRPPKVFVLPGSPAERAGIRSGDRVTAINGRPVKRIEDVLVFWSQLNLDKGLRLSLLREGKRVEAKLTAEFYQGLSRSSEPVVR
ncbi:MAG: PDZ domain-containing protein [Planctomycetota bacterium]